jgi:hypothetical protein
MRADLASTPTGSARTAPQESTGLVGKAEQVTDAQSEVSAPLVNLERDCRRLAANA